MAERRTCIHCIECSDQGCLGLSPLHACLMSWGPWPGRGGGGCLFVSIGGFGAVANTTITITNFTATDNTAVGGCGVHACANHGDDVCRLCVSCPSSPQACVTTLLCGVACCGCGRWSWGWGTGDTAARLSLLPLQRQPHHRRCSVPHQQRWCVPYPQPPPSPTPTCLALCVV